MQEERRKTTTSSKMVECAFHKKFLIIEEKKRKEIFSQFFQSKSLWVSSSCDESLSSGLGRRHLCKRSATSASFKGSSLRIPSTV